MSISPEAFDLLVVLDGRSAKSAADETYTEEAPYPHESTYVRSNDSYAFFLQQCAEQSLRAAFTTLDDVVGPGLFSSYWTYTDRWQRVLKPAQTNFIFDKFSSSHYENLEQVRLLHSGSEPVILFHRDEIRNTFDNKLNTFLNFPDHTIPTAPINIHSQEHITTAKKELAEQILRHRNSTDFTATYIVKDQFGSGGANIYLIENDDEYEPLRREHTTTTFILQPFIETSQSHFEEYTGRIDLRAIILNGEIVQSFIRIAKPGEYRANAYRGGRLVYIDLEKIPEEILNNVADIKKRLPIDDTLFALDFIQSDAGNYYLVEGNSMPGLNWFIPENEKHAHYLMRLIIQNIKPRILQC